MLFLNDIVKSEDFELSDKNFRTIKLPNESNFFDDDLAGHEKTFWKKNLHDQHCAAGEAEGCWPCTIHRRDARIQGAESRIPEAKVAMMNRRVMLTATAGFLACV